MCSPITSRIDVGDYPHLQGLALADSTKASSTCIDILVGAGHYYDSVIGEIVKGASGPVAISSKLGWLLSGLLIVNEACNCVDACLKSQSAPTFVENNSYVKANIAVLLWCYKYLKMEVTKNNKKNTKREFIWTDEEISLLLQIIINYKATKMARGLDWETVKAKYEEIMELFHLRYPKEGSGVSPEEYPNSADPTVVSKEHIVTKIKRIRNMF